MLSTSEFEYHVRDILYKVFKHLNFKTLEFEGINYTLPKVKRENDKLIIVDFMEPSVNEFMSNSKHAIKYKIDIDKNGICFRKQTKKGIDNLFIAK
jgi:hypothetical protein